MWKVENIPNELGDIVKEISNQSVESPFFFFPIAYSKISGKERGTKGKSSRQKKSQV